MNKQLMTLVTTLMISFACLGQPVTSPVEDPIAEQILPGAITVTAEEFVRLPRSVDSAQPTQTNQAFARLQYMQPLPDGSGRLAVNDLRGLLYLTDEQGSNPTVYLDLRVQNVSFDDSMFPNETGLAGFAFHPDFANAGTAGFGKFYTAYSTPSDSGIADYLDDNSDNHESVIREWTADDVNANVFNGSSREVFRIGQFDQNHNIGNLVFNYSANPGDEDYGLLYASFGDAGAAHDPEDNGQDLGTPMSSIIRINPLQSDESDESDDGAAYTIPADNPFVNQAGAAPEIWAYGLRHPQHFSFDEGTMYIADIGQSQIEEINIGIKGANYGWRVREGTFATAMGLEGVRPGPVYPPPVDNQELTYPIAQFDHDEGYAVSSVFVYRGEDIPQLYGKLLFCDMVTGRIFYTDSEDLNPGEPALIEELNVRVNGEVQNLAEAVGFTNTYRSGNRAGLRMGWDSRGELYLLTKGDGWIRKLVVD